MACANGFFSRGDLLNCSVPAVSMISSITCLPCLVSCVSQMRLPNLSGRCFSYIHVDRFAICVLDCWIIALDEDSLDELRCIPESLVSMRAIKPNHNNSHVGIGGEEKKNIPVKALFPTPPDPRTAMLYSLHAQKHHKRNPRYNRIGGSRKKRANKKIAYLCCPARDDMIH